MLSFSVGAILGVTGLLKLSNNPYSGQQIFFRIYKDKNLLDKSSQFTDKDGEATVAFDTSQYLPDIYKLEAEWINEQKPLVAYIEFTLVEDKVNLTLRAGETNYVSGSTIELTCSVLTPRDVPKDGVTVRFVDLYTQTQWNSVTNNLGVAQVQISTKPEDEQKFLFQAYFSGEESNKVEVSITPKVELELRANASIFNAGDEGIFTATLTKGGKPFPDQAVKFTVE